MKDMILNQALQLGFLKSGFSIIKKEGKTTIQSKLSNSEIGKHQIETTLNSLNLAYKIVQIPSIFDGVTTDAYMLLS